MVKQTVDRVSRAPANPSSFRRDGVHQSTVFHLWRRMATRWNPAPAAVARPQLTAPGAIAAGHDARLAGPDSLIARVCSQAVKLMLVVCSWEKELNGAALWPRALQ